MGKAIVYHSMSRPIPQEGLFSRDSKYFGRSVFYEYAPRIVGFEGRIG